MAKPPIAGLLAIRWRRPIADRLDQRRLCRISRSAIARRGRRFTPVLAHRDSAALAPPTAGVDPFAELPRADGLPVDARSCWIARSVSSLRAFAEVLEADTPVAIDEGERWPAVVLATATCEVGVDGSCGGRL